jgi:hypothetical protein
MSNRWRHTICDACWTWRCLERDEPGREPVRIVERLRSEVKCCFCATDTRSGIFVRDDPASPELRCGGEHAEERKAETT